MALLILYWSFLAVFYIGASKLRSREFKRELIDKSLNVIICILVFVMGLRMGANEEVTANLGTIGIQSVGITVFAVGGSMAAVTLMRKALRLDRRGMHVCAELPQAEESCVEKDPLEEKSEKQTGAGFTLTILLFVTIGMVLGYGVIPKLFDDVDSFQDMSGDWLVVGICILLSIVGFSLGLDGTVFKSLKEAGVKALLIPVAAVLGSIAVGGLFGIISPLTIREAVAVSAGFGWYTLAPSMIGEAGLAVAGAVSFLHNVIRETLGIVAIPLAAKKIGYLEATAIPGVAAMDVCIPIVKRSCRPETVVYSLCTGILMNAAVPVIVQLAIG